MSIHAVSRLCVCVRVRNCHIFLLLIGSEIRVFFLCSDCVLVLEHFELVLSWKLASLKVDMVNIQIIFILFFSYHFVPSHEFYVFFSEPKHFLLLIHVP